MIDAMIKDSKKDKKNGSNGGSGVSTPSGGVQTHIKTEPQTPDPLTANAGTTVPSASVKDEPNTPNGDPMNNCENSGNNNCATLGGQGGPQPTGGPDIKPNVCGPGGGMNQMMGPNGVVGNNPMDNFLNDPTLDMKPGGGDLGPENCGPLMGQMKMEDQSMAPGHDFGGMGDPMSGNMGPMNPMMSGPGNMVEMSVHKQPSTLDAQYMQQQSQIFVFSTQLANEAAEAVIHGQCPSIIAFHCSQPGTKKFLEKHPLKINQFNRNPSQILTQLAMKKGPQMGRGMGFGGPNMMPGGGSNMMGDFMGPGGPGGPMGPSGPMGPGMGNWNQNNCDSMPGMGPMNPGGMGPRMGMPGNMGPGMMPCCPVPHGNMVPCGPGSGPPCSQSGPMGMQNKPQMDGNMMSPIPAGSPMMPGGGQNRQVPMSMAGMMGPGSMPMGSSMSGINKDLLGVKVPDENLTPQQMQHRAEKLAKMKIMKQMLFPEQQGPGGPENMGQMNPGSGTSPCPPGGPMMGGPGMMNPMNQGPGPMPQGGGPMMMPMMGNKMMGPCNMGPDGPNMMPSSGLNSASAQMEWQKLQAQFFDEQRKKKGSGPSPGMMMSGMGPMGQGGMGPMGQGGMSPMQMGSPSGPMGMMGPGGMNMGMMGPMSGPRMSGPAGARMQGPPPPYPQGQRSGSASGGPMPSPLQSQGPPSPPLSLPSPRNTANMESPADRGFNQRLSGNMGPASVPGPSPSGILNTPLDSPNPSVNQPRPMGNVSNPGTPVTGPGPPHVSPGMRKDNMVPDFSNSMGGMLGAMNNSGNAGGDMFGRPMPPFSQGQIHNQQSGQNQQKGQNNMSSSNKEPNLMPVPSPQQIQYFEGQELTIQKQPNTSLRESDLLSPSMPASSIDSGLPSSSEMQGPRMSGGPNTPTTPSSTADNPPPRYPGPQTPHTPNGNFPTPSPGGPPTSQGNSGPSSDKNQRFPGPSPQVSSGPKTPGTDSVPTSDNVTNKFSAPSPSSGSQNIDSEFARFTSQNSSQSQNRISTSPLFDVSPPKMSDIAGFGGPPDNVPINPMSGPMGSKIFDPISSMAQMSQQLTNTVGPAIGPSSPPLITSMAPTNQSMTFSSGGPGMGMPSQMGVGMVNFNSSMTSMQGMQQMGDGPMMGPGPGGAQTVNNTYVSATMNIQQMNIQSMHGGGSYNPMMQGPPNPMMSGDPSIMKGGMPSNPMMMGGPQRPMGPGGPYPQMGPGGPQQMIGPGPMVSQRMMGPNTPMNRPTGPFNGANVQVKASAPNTIQYLPSRPQTANPSPRGPPRLDFLPTFSGPMDSKGGGSQGMQFFPGGANSGPSGGMPMNMIGPNGPGNQNMPSGGPMSMGGGMSSMPMNMGGPSPMMGMNGPMGSSGPGGGGMGSMPMGNMMSGPGNSGMGPSGPMNMNMPGGPMGPGPSMNMMPGGMNMSMGSQGMSMVGPRAPNSGQMMRPQQMGGMYQGPGGPMSNEAMFMSGGGGPMQMNPSGNNPMMMPGGGGFSGGKQSQMGPDPSQPMNGPQFKGSYMGPSAADPNYAQQFHNFQQQLYATNSRNQMGNPNMGMAGQSFFGPK